MPYFVFKKACRPLLTAHIHVASFKEVLASDMYQMIVTPHRFPNRNGDQINAGVAILVDGSESPQHVRDTLAVRDTATKNIQVHIAP